MPEHNRNKEAGNLQARLSDPIRHTGLAPKGMRPQDLGIGRLFERTRDAAIVADATTQRIVLWNSAAANIFGYSTSEALGLRVEALVPEHLKERHRMGITRYAETGRGPYIDSDSLLELPAQRKDGRAIYIEMSLSPIGPVVDTDSDSGKHEVSVTVPIGVD